MFNLHYLFDLNWHFAYLILQKTANDSIPWLWMFLFLAVRPTEPRLILLVGNQQCH